MLSRGAVRADRSFFQHRHSIIVIYHYPHIPLTLVLCLGYSATAPSPNSHRCGLPVPYHFKSTLPS